MSESKIEAQNVLEQDVSPEKIEIQKEEENLKDHQESKENSLNQIFSQQRISELAENYQKHIKDLEDKLGEDSISEESKGMILRNEAGSEEMAEEVRARLGVSESSSQKGNKQIIFPEREEKGFSQGLGQESFKEVFDELNSFSRRSTNFTSELKTGIENIQRVVGDLNPKELTYRELRRFSDEFMPQLKTGINKMQEITERIVLQYGRACKEAGEMGKTMSLERVRNIQQGFQLDMEELRKIRKKFQQVVQDTFEKLRIFSRKVENVGRINIRDSDIFKLTKGMQRLLELSDPERFSLGEKEASLLELNSKLFKEEMGEGRKKVWG